MQKLMVFALSVIVSLFIFVPAVQASEIIFDNFPVSTPTNVDGINFAETNTFEIGDYIKIDAPSQPTLASFILTSNAQEKDYSSYGDSSGYRNGFVLRIYDNPINLLTKTPLYTAYTEVVVPWLSETQDKVVFTVDFDLSDKEWVLPEQFVYGFSFKTYNNDYEITGPYDTLSVGYANTGGMVNSIFVGQDLEPDTVYLNRLPVNGWSDKPIAVRIEAKSNTDNKCKNDGWKTYSGLFKNQGECVSSFVKK